MQANIGYTTAERDARSWSNGDVIHNLTTNKLELRSAGVWIDNPICTSVWKSDFTKATYQTLQNVSGTSGDNGLVVFDVINGRLVYNSLLLTPNFEFYTQQKI